MAGDGKKTGDDAPRSAADGPTWAGLLQAAGARLLPLVVSASALLGFVAFAGAVIVWTRFFAVKVPPDQIVTAVPRSELVATGSSLLLLFGFFGVLAVLAMYLVDRGGRATPGMARGLLILLAIEGMTAILIDAGGLSWGAVFATGVFLAPLSTIFAATFFEQLTLVDDSLPSRDDETLDPNPRLLNSRKKGNPLVEKWELVALLVLLTAVTGAFALLGLREPEWLTIVGWVAVGVASVLASMLTARAARRVWKKQSKYREKKRNDETRLKKEKKAREEKVKNEQAAAVERVEQAKKRLWEIRKGSIGAGIGLLERLRLRLGTSQRPTWVIPAEARAEEALRRYEKEESSLREVQSGGAESDRRRKPRSNRLNFRARGVILAVVAMGLGTWLPAAVLHEPWVALSLGAAAILTLGLWRVAGLSKTSFLWFGLAAFLSVPLFGTLTLMARNLDDPQIQPVALIRSTDRHDEAIHGLYVTEAKERVYFASAATEGCTGTLRENSGRLLWVPKDEVVAMSIGPLQSVGDAAKTSLEMAFALTPAVETPAGDSVSLTPGEVRSEEGGLGEEAPLTVQRLENVGPAVRPTFGRGLVLKPEDATPGEVVTLKMSTPIKDGFGIAPEGRTLRVGGAPATIVRNPTLDAERAEYVTTEDGRTVKLDEEMRLYVRDDDGSGMTPLEHPSDRPETTRYVKVAEGEGIAGPYVEDGEHPGVYLELEEYPTKAAEADLGNDPPERVANGVEVTFKERELDEGEVQPVEPVGIGPMLERQAWNKDEIKFELPEKASSGVVTLDCEQLAGQPLLRVPRPPKARIEARLLSSGKIALDSRRSGDDGRLVARRWTVNGRSRFRGTGESGKGDEGEKDGRRRVKGVATAVLPVSRRLAVHRIQLTVEDADGESDTATVHLLRIPRPSIAFAGKKRDADGKESQDKPPPRRPGMVKRLSKAVVERAKQEAPIAVMVDAHAHGEKGPRRVEKSRKTARATIGRLLNPETAEGAGLEASVPVVTRAFGEGCDHVVPGSHKDRHVDVFILGEGVSLGKPEPCDPRHVERREWKAKDEGDGGASGDRGQ